MPRALFKLLTLVPVHRMRREEALEALWPGLPQRAALNNFYVTLHVDCPCVAQ